MADLEYISATAALKAFASHEVSPVEVMEAVLAQADRVEPVVNALVHRFSDDALAQAREAEKRYMGKGEQPRALEGLAVAIKEETPICGRPWTQGSLLYEDLVADFTAPVPERVLAHGGIVHAMTAAPEFSCTAWTNSRLHGITRNPWNPDFSPGGSSGGAAAALAAGTTTLATGSDIGGSNRIPPGFCGVVGYKPPYGRVPSYPPFNLDYYCHEGPEARTVSDCLLLQRCIAGPHRLDVASVPMPPWVDPAGRGVRGWKIGVAPTLGGFLINEEAVANTLAVADAFRQAGAIVEEVDFGWSVEDFSFAAGQHFKSIFVAFIENVPDEKRELLCEYTLDWLELLDGDLDLPAALETEGRLFAKLSAAFAEYRVLLCPTNAVRGFPAEQASLLDLPEVNGVKPQSFFAIMPTIVFNMFSRCPVMTVPSGFASNGLPTAVQIAGAPYDEESVFEAAIAFEAARPWMDSAEHRPALLQEARRR